MSRKRETNKYISQKRKGTNKIHRKEAKKKGKTLFKEKLQQFGTKSMIKKGLKENLRFNRE